MVKNIIMIIALAIFISSCSRLNPSSDQNDNINDPSTDNGNTDNGNTDDSLIEDDNKYPYLPIKLKEFVVTDKNSTSSDATADDNRKSREISIEEKAHVLEAIDIMRFVVNTSEFKDEFFNDIYKFEAAEYGRGIRTIKKGDYYYKNIIFNMLKNAAITTYIMKDDINGTANALGTLGPHFYVNVNATNPIIEGDKNGDLDLLIMLPNNFYWAEKNGFYGDKYKLAEIIFHELIHNLGFNHLNNSPNEIWNQYDTAEFMEDIFREVVSKSKFKNKYKSELKQYNYYQTKYKKFLKSKTIPK